MPIDFPNSPSLNQTFTSGTRTWTWNGTTWNLTSYGAQGPQGTTGAQGATGSTGFVVCTSSTRPGSPTTGQNIYETDTGDHLVYYGATTGWRPPWYMPWGETGFFSTTTAYQTTSSSIVEINTAFRLTVTTIANRRLKFTFSGNYANVGGGGLIDIYNVTASSIVGRAFQHNSTIGDGILGSGVVVATSSSSSTVYTIRWQIVTAGTLYVGSSSQLSQFIIEDIGPATANPPAS